MKLEHVRHLADHRLASASGYLCALHTFYQAQLTVLPSPDHKCRWCDSRRHNHHVVNVVSLRHLDGEHHKTSRRLFLCLSSLACWVSSSGHWHYSESEDRKATGWYDLTHSPIYWHSFSVSLSSIKCKPWRPLLKVRMSCLPVSPQDSVLLTPSSLWVFSKSNLLLGALQVTVGWGL